MDVIFDIDGTLANAEHRLHFINDPDKAKDWENFLSDEQIAKDTPIEPVWEVLESLVLQRHRVIFITGRPETQRQTTYDWLYPSAGQRDVARCAVNYYWDRRSSRSPIIYMRKAGDRRPSHVVKEELLQVARMDGFNPKIVFEDRNDDTAMWRRNGLICCQVADGDY